MHHNHHRVNSNKYLHLLLKQLLALNRPQHIILYRFPEPTVIKNPYRLINPMKENLKEMADMQPRSHKTLFQLWAIKRLTINPSNIYQVKCSSPTIILRISHWCLKHLLNRATNMSATSANQTYLGTIKILHSFATWSKTITKNTIRELNRKRSWNNKTKNKPLRANSSRWE